MLKNKATKIICYNNEKTLTVNNLTWNRSNHFIKADLYNNVEN